MSPVSDHTPHILVIDDDRRIRSLLQSYLADAGYRVTVAASAAEARDRMRGMAFDLLVLDVMMPGESGLGLVQELRQEANGVPVIFLSALTEADDRVAGLQAGGDDYLPKPFEPRELVLRIQNLLRWQGAAEPVSVEARFGACTFNPQRGDLRRNGKPVHLTTRERDLLKLFVTRAGRTLTRADLTGDAEGARTIDVQINRLRRKIEDDPASPVYLQTVRGSGYVMYLD
jgi:two-component system phosphate regulon response regulator OmpR